MTDNSPATSEELDKAQKEVVDDIRHLKNLMKALLAIVFVALAIISTSTVLTMRAGSEAKKASKSNNIFLSNFSNYMRCLVINDDKVVLAYGEENYFNLCDKLLFDNTGVKQHKVTVTIPDPDKPAPTPDSSTTTGTINH